MLQFDNSAYNIGTDFVSLVIIDNSTGLPIDLGGRLVSFDDKPDVSISKSEGIDNGGKVFKRRIPEGVTGTIVIDRRNDNWEAVEADMDNKFYTNGENRTFTVTASKRDADTGTIKSYQYRGAILYSQQGASWRKATTPVQIHLTMEAVEKVGPI